MPILSKITGHERRTLNDNRVIKGGGIVMYKNNKIHYDFKSKSWILDGKIEGSLSNLSKVVGLNVDTHDIGFFLEDNGYVFKKAFKSDEQFIHTDSDIESQKYEDEYFEGKKKKKFSSYYERVPKLRAATIKHHGIICKVCGFDFEKVYGKHGSGYIEVHHLAPVSSLKASTKIKPEEDMAVVCSNCHRMIHRQKDNVLSPDELRNLLNI